MLKLNGAAGKFQLFNMKLWKTVTNEVFQLLYPRKTSFNRMQGGDSLDNHALTKYIGLFHSSVYRLAYSYLKNRENAEDICQEAFLRLYSFKGDFPDDNGCKAWLFRVAVNLSKNLLRSCHTIKRAELTDDIPLESKEDSGLLECVMALPPKYRITIHLFYYEGYSVKEIAGILGTTTTAVTTQLSRGREKLKKMLQEEGLQ